MAAAPAAAAVWAGCAVVLRAGLSALGCAGWCGAAGGPRPGALLCAGLAGLYGGCSAAGGLLGGRQRGRLARWYMAVGLAAGALAWQKAIVPPLHALAAWIVRLLLAPARWGRRYIAVPLRKAACARLAALKSAAVPADRGKKRENQKNLEKTSCKRSRRYYIISYA